MNGYQFIMGNNLAANYKEGVLLLPSIFASRVYLPLLQYLPFLQDLEAQAFKRAHFLLGHLFTLGDK